MVVMKGERPFPVIDDNPSFLKLLANMKTRDFVIWGSVTAVSYPIGWQMGGRLFRGPMSVACMATGFFAGMGLAVQNSFHRLGGFTDPNE